MGAVSAVTAAPNSNRASACPRASHKITARSAPPESTRAGSPGTLTRAPTAPLWCPFHAAYPSATFHATTAPALVPTARSSPSKATRVGSPSPASAETSRTIPPSPVRTSKSAAMGSIGAPVCGSCPGTGAWTHAMTEPQFAVSRRGEPRATPSTLNAPRSFPVSSSHATKVRFAALYAVRSWASPLTWSLVIGPASTLSGWSRRTYPRVPSCSARRHVCAKPWWVPTATVVPSNASALTVAGARPSPALGRPVTSSETLPTRITCFSDQSRTSKMWRRAESSPSAATTMFLKMATCWNAPRGGSETTLARWTKETASRLPSDPAS